MNSCVSYFELVEIYGEGSQWATITAIGDRIAAAAEWFIQNAAIAGVAAFASAVSNSTTVGM
jgi:hypothetical protein